MAYLRDPISNKKCFLLAHHTFGRDGKSVDTWVNRPEISRIHAVIEWKFAQWELRVLGRNGVWLDGKRLDLLESAQLKKNQVIHFADPNGAGWKVGDLAEPCDMIIGLNEESIDSEVDSYHLLPNVKSPVAALFFCNKQEQWLLEYNESRTTIENHGIIDVPPYRWELFLSTIQSPTLALSNIEYSPQKINLDFSVSLDEEHIYLNASYKRHSSDLGERSHHYLLLHLARLKSQHAADGVDLDSQGWISNEQLERELGVDMAYINIQIFRARKQLADEFSGQKNLTDIIQRRRGEMRIDCHLVTIRKGGAEEKFDLQSTSANSTSSINSIKSISSASSSASVTDA